MLFALTTLIQQHDGEYVDEEDSMYGGDGATSEGNSRIWKDMRGILMISFAVFACVVLFIIGIISYTDVTPKRRRRGRLQSRRQQGVRSVHEYHIKSL